MPYVKDKQFYLSGNTVAVTDDQFEKALRKFKKRVQESGKLREVQERAEYIKPSIQRKRAKGAAEKRWKKYLQSQELPPKSY
jgi:small subunit ribosomal protein S21